MTLTLNRRLLVRASAAPVLAGSTILTAPALISAQTPEGATPAPPDGPFTLPDLAYAFDALEPNIDAETMELHHDKHHQTYVNNLNTALADHPDLQSATIEELLTDLASLPEAIQTSVRNNGGGHYNHTFFWEIIGPEPGAASPELAEAIDRDFGGMEALTTAVNEAGAKRFGSGWAWLISIAGTLTVSSTPNQDNTLMDGTGIPVLGVDVWEHAYYLKYRSARPDYLTAFWNVVNWTAVSEKYAESLQ